MDEVVEHIYNGILLSHKNEWIDAIWSNVNAIRGDHTKWSKSEKDKYHMISLICDNKNHINDPIYKKETDSQA